MGSLQSTPGAPKKRTYGSSKLVPPKELFDKEENSDEEIVPDLGYRTFLDKRHQTISTIYDTSSESPLKSSKSESQLLIKEKRSKYQPLQHLPYAAVWSRSFFPGAKGAATQQPKQRTGTCFAYSEKHDLFIFAYGKSAANEETFFRDAWILDFKSRSWRCLTTKLKSPRIGSRAVIVGTKMYVFGGFYHGKYFADLHSIDILTGGVEDVKTAGQGPKGRTTPVLVHYPRPGGDGEKLLVWGGYNGESQSELFVLDLESLVWEKHRSFVAGRSDPSYSHYGNKLYIFGSSKRQGLLQVNLDTYLFEEVFTTGIEPPSAENGSAMVRVGRYMIVFGGSGQKYTHFYAYDVEKKWWFVFSIEPDHRSVQYEDGSVLKNGLFMVPSEHSFAFCYRERTKEIFSVFGRSYGRTKVQVTRFYIGEALPVLNLREDMLQALDAQ